MRFTGGFAAVLLGTAVLIVQPLVTKALEPQEIASIAEKITVRIDGANYGSGVIIERQDNSYTVVTNWHVLKLKGSYTVQTFDSKKYTINRSQVKRLAGVDLAVFEFTSNENYSVAEKGNSDQIRRGQTIYVGGYPTGIPGIPGREFLFLEGQISGRAQNPKEGYALIYIVQPFQGMSGGLVLDEEGKLVGIHGSSGTQYGGGGTVVLGIPLKTYLSLAPYASTNICNTQISLEEAVKQGCRI